MRNCLFGHDATFLVSHHQSMCYANHIHLFHKFRGNFIHLFRFLEANFCHLFLNFGGNFSHLFRFCGGNGAAGDKKRKKTRRCTSSFSSRHARWCFIVGTSLTWRLECSGLSERTHGRRCRRCSSMFVSWRKDQRTAMTSISTRTFLGRVFTATAERAG